MQSGPDQKSSRRETAALLWTGASLLVAAVASIFFGSAGLHPREVMAGLDALWRHGPAFSGNAQIIWLRCLRIGLGLVVGASLGLSGFLLQTAFRNPLADSYLLGVSGGAQLAVTVVALLGAAGALAAVPVMIVAPLLGALAVLGLLLLLSRRVGHDLLAFLLSGLALSYVLDALYSIIITVRPNLLSNSVFWSWMGLNRASSAGFWVAGGGLVLTVPFILSMMQPLRAYLVGDDFALNLGVDPSHTRLRLLLFSVVLAATDVAVSGVVGFVGLFAPHLARMFIHRTDRSFVVMTMLMGALAVVIGDVIARSVSASEIPLNTVLSLFGAPYLIWLAVKTRRTV